MSHDLLPLPTLPDDDDDDRDDIWFGLAQRFPAGLFVALFALAFFGYGALPTLHWLTSVSAAILHALPR